MGKKKKVKKVKKPIPYTRQQRNAKITKILMQLMSMKLSHLISTDIRKKIDHWINTGETYQEEIFLPVYSRTMDINLINDKRVNTYIKFKFHKINVEDEKSQHLNELNRLQEDLFKIDHFS